MKRSMLWVAGILFALGITAQETTVVPPESLVVDGVPKIPGSLAETAGRYGEYRSASLSDWQPGKHAMLISTRFAATPQLHLVSEPGGERHQLTFFTDAVRAGSFHPKSGDYIVFPKDIGGGEWYQLFRLDLGAGNVTLLTDGKSRNSLGPWSNKGDQIAYMSTRRTGKDTDLWVMNPAEPKSDRLLTKLEGGGWEPLDWSPDDSKILLKEELSINEAYLWLVNTATGEKTALFPTGTKRADKIAYGDARFSKDGKKIYLTSDAGAEYLTLGAMDIQAPELKYLLTGPGAKWDVDRFELSDDGKLLAFVKNENGLSVLHVLRTSNNAEVKVPAVPQGVIGSLRWNNNNRDLGFSLVNAQDPGDVFSLNVETGKVERWTNSETAVLTKDFPAAELVK
jgi:Tol biopolymer transport system component